MTHQTSILARLLLAASVLTLQACGGGGSSSGEVSIGSNGGSAEELSASVLAGGVSPATLDTARGVAVDRQGNVDVADSNNHTIRKIPPQGQVSTVAGNLSGDLALSKLPIGLGSRIQGIAISISDNALLITADNGVLRLNGRP